jgi:hypothetical protein
VIRHKAGQLSNSEVYLEVIPQDDVSDPKLAETAKAMLEQDLQDPAKRYRDVRDLAALDAFTSGLGCYRVDFDKRLGPWGDTVFTHVDGSRVWWTPGYYPHDPRCPWFYEWDHMGVDEVAQMENWSNNDDLQGDTGSEPGSTKGGTLQGAVDLTSNFAPRIRPSNLQKYVTVVFLYERFKYADKKVEKRGTYQELDQADQYMACDPDNPNHCGYKGDTAGQQWEDGTLDKGESLPATVPGGCPDCAAQGQSNDLVRIDATTQEYVVSAEHRLTIFAPFEAGGGKVFWQGPWPYAMRSIPYFVWACYPHITKPYSQSETSLNRSMQSAKNLVMRLGIENMILALPRTVVSTAARNYRDEPWQGDEADGLNVYINPFAMGNQPALQMVQAPGLPAAWATLNASIDADLRADTGTADMNFSPDQSRDIPVATMQIQEKTQEIPMQHQIDRFRRAESFPVAVLWDIKRATMTEAQLVRWKGDQGHWIAAQIRGADMPGMDIVITDDPSTLKVEADQIDTMMKIAGTPAPGGFIPNPPPVVEFLARAANVAPSLLQKFQTEMAEWQKSQMPPPGMVPGAPAGGQAGGPGGPVPPGSTSAGGPPSPGTMNGMRPPMAAANGGGVMAPAMH